MFFRLVLPNPLFTLRDSNLALGLLRPPRRHVVWRDSVGVESSRLNHSARIFFTRVFSGCYAILSEPQKRAKQLSMATVPLCFEFFQCRVDVLQS